MIKASPYCPSPSPLPIQLAKKTEKN